eukprot:scaffold10947_cov123-Isochrysis_galbana.AAC.5
MHGWGGWLGLALYIGPGWGYGGGPRRGVGRGGPLFKVPTVTPRGAFAPVIVLRCCWSRFRDPFGVSLADAFCLSGGVLSWSVDCVLCEVIFGEMVVESIGEEELSLFAECGEGGQPCSVYVEGWGGFSSANGEELCTMLYQ